MTICEEPYRFTSKASITRLWCDYEVLFFDSKYWFFMLSCPLFCSLFFSCVLSCRKELRICLSKVCVWCNLCKMWKKNVHRSYQYRHMEFRKVIIIICVFFVACPLYLPISSVTLTPSIISNSIWHLYMNAFEILTFLKFDVIWIDPFWFLKIWFTILVMSYDMAT